MVKPTDLQIELVKTFSIPMSEETVLEIKDMPGNYFLQKMDTLRLTIFDLVSQKLILKPILIF
jgi:hypothetical protein